MDYGYVLEPGRDGGWWAYAPDLPGCIAAGDTMKEAAVAMRSAARAYVKELQRMGEEVPRPSREITAYPETEPGYRIVQAGG